VTFCIVEFCSIKVLIHPKKKKIYSEEERGKAIFIQGSLNVCTTHSATNGLAHHVYVMGFIYL
jgi:hypothetical protein